MYASALVKKRRYWPKNVDGEDAKRHMEHKEVGVTCRRPGVIDGEAFDLFCLKEPDYCMLMMSTYGSLNKKADQKESVRIVDGERKTFYYNNIVGNHFEYRDSVDNHNAKRHDCSMKERLGIEKI